MHITIAYAEDWMGLYIDGTLRREGHSLDTEDVLKELGIEHQSKLIDRYSLGRRDRLPIAESNVVWEGQNPHAWAQVRS